jgi:hypothetical protein
METQLPNEFLKEKTKTKTTYIRIWKSCVSDFSGMYEFRKIWEKFKISTLVLHAVIKQYRRTTVKLILDSLEVIW